MKFILSTFTGLTATLSFLNVARAASNSTNGPSCGALKADDSFFSVVGVQLTGVQPRQELRELEKDTELWNIFLQAFARFKAMDQKDKISYYGVASVHGAPFGKWDKVEGCAGHEEMGYCTHQSNLFATWHRPYLALFEQILHDRAVDVANEYPIGEARDKAMTIAHKVRLPYWDWAIDPPNKEEGVIPACIRKPTATVTFPNGTKAEIENPLYRYDFHPLQYNDFSALSEFRFKDWNHTIRYPADGFSIDATSRDDEVNERMKQQQPNLRDILYKLLTTYQPFAQVSTKASGGTIGNFETLHDGIHNVFGLGHMGIVEVSAFDPVFWFHHCNMDRIFTFYQTRYPDTWVEDAKQSMGTFTMPKDSMQGGEAPLTPFHMNAKGDMWTSNTVRNWTAFGYTYPEVVNNPSNDSFTAALNQLYKPATQGIGNYTNATLPYPPNSGTNATVQATDWQCKVNMPSNIKASYSVRIFLGEPGPDPKQWLTDPNYVGQLATFSSSRMESDLIITGNVGLNQKLALKHAAGELASLGKEDVAAYLKVKFTWRIQAVDYSEIPRSAPPAGLNVTIFNVPITIPKSDTEVPKWNGVPDFKPDIEGIVPVYNGNGPDGTNSTSTSGSLGGMYNATLGQFEWKNAPDPMPKPPKASSSPVQSSAKSSAKPSATSSFQSVSSVGASSVVDSPVVSSVVASSATAPDTTPAPTAPSAGPHTQYITTVVMVTI